MNEYGLKTIYNIEGTPLYIVEIKHEVLTAFHVFATDERRAAYIEKEAADLVKYAPIEYKKCFSFSQGLIKEYSEAETGRLFENLETGALYLDKETPKTEPKKLTLAELKRNAKAGCIALDIVYRFGEEIPEKMRGARQIVGVRTAAIDLLNKDGVKSELRFEAASLTEYTPETLTIYAAGVRDLTPEERAEMDRADIERKTYQEQNPYSDSFYHMRTWFKNSPFSYLSGLEEYTGSKRLYHTRDGVKIIDRAIKGDVMLKYKVITA